MNTVTVAGRLEALQRSLEAARSTPHSQVPASIRQQHDLYMQGLNDGVQLAIDAITWELRTIAAGEATAVVAQTHAPEPRTARVPQPRMVEQKCKWCKEPFQARAADVKRGWGLYCSKSCKAMRQEKRTGQYRALQDRDGDDAECGHIFQSGYFGHGQE
ncbi:hypothetical protein [Massilia sp. CT11-137]|uniref:hypothetical protein n=1 Tax=Massilia sp. CT11-137 TaxID=3393901 RepID=UPI0039AFE976